MVPFNPVNLQLLDSVLNNYILRFIYPEKNRDTTQ